MTNASQSNAEIIANAYIAHDDDNTQFDIFDAIDEMRSYRPITSIPPKYAELLQSLNSLEFRNLCDMLEICPIHACDINICNDDDDAECAHIR